LDEVSLNLLQMNQSFFLLRAIQENNLS